MADYLRGRMHRGRFPELLSVQHDLVESGRKVTAVYELDRIKEAARISFIQTEGGKYKDLFEKVIYYSNENHPEDKQIISDLYRETMTGGLE